MTRTIFALCALLSWWSWIPLLAAEEGAPPEAVPVHVSVDPRVELMSVIFRLAGNPEYGKGCIRSYNREVDEHFGAHKEHPVIALARDLRRTRGVSYDAPMSLAVHLANGFSLEPAAPLAPRPERLDGRWHPDELRDFLEKARDFARQSGFQQFFESHQALYEGAAGRMKALAQHAHLDWFGPYFGVKEKPAFHVVIGMLNGPGSYGPSFSGAGGQKLYCILGAWQLNMAGEPTFSKGVLPTVVHEFCHSFVNPVVYAHASELKEAGEAIYSRVEAGMRKMAYGNWKTMMHESLVRACVVRYRTAHEGRLAATGEMLQQWALGFAWVPKLAQVLEEYENDRKRYLTLEDFFPRIVEFFDQYAESLSPQPAEVTAQTAPG